MQLLYKHILKWLLVRQEVGQWLELGPVLNVHACPLPILVDQYPLLISVSDLMFCSLTEKTLPAEVKEFYTEHHSTVFYVVYSSFCYVETAILERGTCVCVSAPRH